MLSLALGQKPHLLPQFTATPAVTPVPTAPLLSTFLFDDNSGSYESISSYTIETLSKQGIYGQPSSLSALPSAFSLFTSQLYLQGQKTAGILNISNHFFYPTSLGSLPLTVSPTHTKALFVSTTVNPKTKLSTSQFRLQTATATVSAYLSYPAVLSTNPNPLCWSHDENTVVFTTPSQNTLLFYSLNDQKAKTATLSATLSGYAHVYCNSNTNSLYFTTKNAVYKQGFNQATATLLPVMPQTFDQTPVFSPDSSDTILIGAGNALMQVDLDKNTSKTIYTATDSATLIPYLWKDGTIVYTQQNLKPENGQYYLAGKVLDTTTQVDSVFARHQSANASGLGSITPITWIDVSAQ